MTSLMTAGDYNKTKPSSITDFIDRKLIAAAGEMTKGAISKKLSV